MNLFLLEMNVFKRALANTFRTIKKNSGWFVIFVVLQLVLVILLSSIVVSYQISIANDLEAIGMPLGTLNLDEESIEAGEPVIEDALALYAAYQSLERKLVNLATFLAFIFLVFNGLLWLGANIVLDKKIIALDSLKKRLFSLIQMWAKYTAVVLLLFLSFFVLSYVLLVKFLVVGSSAFSIVAKALLVLFIILIYVYFIGVSLIRTNSWKLFLKRIVNCSFKKPHYSIPAIVVMVALQIMAMFFIYYATLILGHFALMVFAAFLFVFLLFLGKVFLIKLFSELVTTKK
jgi:hypothetical protein